MTDNDIFPYSAFAKSIIGDLQWKHMKCSCGADLPQSPEYTDEGHEFIVCLECGKKYLRITKMPQVKE